MKKIILFMFVFLTILGSVASGADFVDLAADAPYGKAIKVVCDLGIMTSDTEGRFEPKREVSRAEFIDVVMKLAGYQTIGTPKQIFYDVPVSDEYAGVIFAAYNAGYISGNELNMFYPEKAISFSEADSILIRLLGYEFEAIKDGGYPYGYYYTAQDKKIHKGISAGFDNKLTRGEMAQMLYNCLDVPMLEMSAINSGMTEYVEGETASERFLDIVNIKGRMTGNSITSFDSKGGLGREAVGIEFNSYRTDGKYYDDLLGYTVEAFYNKEQEKIVCVVKGDKNETVELTAKDYKGLDDGVISYETDGRERKERLSNRFYVVYNGEYYTSHNENFWKNINGNIKIIDNDGNGDFDIVFVSNYSYYVVTMVNEAEGVIYTKSQMLDCKRYIKNETLFIIDQAHNEILDIGDIEAGSVISVMAGTNVSMTIYANNPVIKGTLTGMDSEFVTIDGNVYGHRISQNNVPMGNVITAYFNHLGDIVYIEIEGSSSTEKYGYLLYAKYFDTDSNTVLKILTEDGERVSFDAADKVKVDGKQCYGYNIGVKTELEVASAAIGSGGTASMLIKYKLNSKGQVNYIDTPYYDRQYENDLTLQSPQTISTRKHYRCVDSTTNGNFEGMFNISRDVKIFLVPSSPQMREQPTNEDMFGVRDMKYFTTDNYYPVAGEHTKIEAYNLDGLYTSDILVVYMDDNASGASDIESGWVTRGSYMVVEKVQKVWDELESEEIWNISGVSNGVIVKYAINKAISETLIGSIIPGDVVAYNISFGKISTLKRVFNYFAKTIDYGSSTYTANDGVNYGELVASNADVFVAEDSNAETKCYIQTGDIYLFDSETNKVSITNYTDMVGREDTFGTGRKALVLMKWGIVCSVIVYK